MAAYEVALAGQPLEIGSACVKPGSIRALAISYFYPTGFRSMKPSTQSTYRNIINRFCQETDREGRAHGDKSPATLRPEHVVKLMAARAERPHSANGLRKAIRAMMRHAMEVCDRTIQPETCGPSALSQVVCEASGSLATLRTVSVPATISPSGATSLTLSLVSPLADVGRASRKSPISSGLRFHSVSP